MIYCFYGTDEYSLEQAVQALLNGQPCQKICHTTEADLIRVIAALKQHTLTANAWVWLQETTVFQAGKVNKELQQRFREALETLRPGKRLLITCSSKPNGTLGLTKWLQQNAEVREFDLTPPWSTDQLYRETEQDARRYGVKLQPAAITVLVQAIGNDRRERFQALEKLSLYQGDRQEPLSAPVVATLVQTTAGTSIRLASQIRGRDTKGALETVHALLGRNEKPQRILQALVTQWRTWLWVKSMLAERHSDLTIAQAAGIGNPNRLYYLKQELRTWTVAQLVSVLNNLLQAEWDMKQGVNGLEVFKTLLFQTQAGA